MYGVSRLSSDVVGKTPFKLDGWTLMEEDGTGMGSKEFLAGWRKEARSCIPLHQDSLGIFRE